MNGVKENMGEELYNCIMGNIVLKHLTKERNYKEKNSKCKFQKQTNSKAKF